MKIVLKMAKVYFRTVFEMGALQVEVVNFFNKSGCK